MKDVKTNGTRSSVLNIRVRPEVHEQLRQVAEDTDRSKSWLAERYIMERLAYEKDLRAKIEQGRKDIREGRTHTLQDVSASIDRIISNAEASRRDQTS